MEESYLPGSSIQLESSLVYNNPVKRILEFGMHAFADTFLSTNDLRFSESVFPLNVVLDAKSGMIHNEYVTQAHDRYNYVDYSYTSSNSKSSISHWKSFIPLLKKIGAKPDDSIIEIGSNDGFLCSLLIEAGYKVNAVDASESMYNLSTSKGIPTHQKIFNSSTALEIKNEIGSVDYLIANNVFNHANDPLDFLIGLKLVLANSGVFIIEVPYWFSQIKNSRFDMIYHEHLSYFTVFSLKNLFDSAGLHINDIHFVDTHGGSLRVIGGLRKIANPFIDELIQNEISNDLFTEHYYEAVAKKIKNIKFKCMNTIYDNYSNRKIFGIGAAAKANTFLTYFGLNSTIVTAITDSSPFKIGKFTPLTRIPIVKDELLSKYDDPVAIVLSWNMKENIKKSLQKINSKIEYLDI